MRLSQLLSGELMLLNLTTGKVEHGFLCIFMSFPFSLPLAIYITLFGTITAGYRLKCKTLWHNLRKPTFKGSLCGHRERIFIREYCFVLRDSGPVKDIPRRRIFKNVKRNWNKI